MPPFSEITITKEQSSQEEQLPIDLVSLVKGASKQASHPCSAITVPPAADKDVSTRHGLAFMKTREYRHEFYAAVKSARKEVAKHLGEKDIAIVSDLDETLIDNSPYYRRHLNGPDASSWHKWIDSAQAPALRPTEKFLSWAREQHVPIFFVTGRSELERASTIKNLANDGFAYDGLYMRPIGNHDKPEELKTGLRKQIADLGFKTIVSLGDQFSDLAGPYAIDCEKIPNKMYFIP